MKSSDFIINIYLIVWSGERERGKEKLVCGSWKHFMLTPICKVKCLARQFLTGNAVIY